MRQMRLHPVHHTDFAVNQGRIIAVDQRFQLPAHLVDTLTVGRQNTDCQQAHRHIAFVGSLHNQRHGSIRHPHIGINGRCHGRDFFHHAADGIFRIIQQDAFPRHAGRRRKDTACQRFGNDHAGEPRLELLLAERFPFDKGKREEAPEAIVRPHHLHFLRVVSPGNLHIGIAIKQAGNGRIGHNRHLLRRLQRHQAFFGGTDAPEEIAVPFPPFILYLVDIKVFAAVHFGHDVGGTDMIHDRYHHHHRNGKSRPDDIHPAVEAVLPHQVPGLFDVLFVHDTVLFVMPD